MKLPVGGQRLRRRADLAHRHALPAHMGGHFHRIIRDAGDREDAAVAVTAFAAQVQPRDITIARLRPISALVHAFEEREVFVRQQAPGVGHGLEGVLREEERVARAQAVTLERT